MNYSSNLSQIISQSKIEYTPGLIIKFRNENTIYKTALEKKKNDDIRRRGMNQAVRPFSSIVDHNDRTGRTKLSMPEIAAEWKKRNLAPLVYFMKNRRQKESYLISVMHILLNNSYMCTRISQTYNKAQGLILNPDYKPFFEFAKLIKENYEAKRGLNGPIRPAKLSTLINNFISSLQTYFNHECFGPLVLWDAFAFFQTLLRYFDQSYTELNYIMDNKGLFDLQNRLESKYQTKWSRTYKCSSNHMITAPANADTFLLINMTDDLHHSIEEFFKPVNFRDNTYYCTECKKNTRSTRSMLCERFGTNFIIKTNLFNNEVKFLLLF